MAEPVEVGLRAAVVSVVPRGMLNPRHACYINCVLQCLVHCPPLYHYIMDHVRPLRLPPPTTTSVATSSTGLCPVLRAIVQLFTEFAPCPLGSPERLRPGRPFSPHYIWSVLEQQQSPGGGAAAMSVHSQEDAQEFLGFLLDSLHTELSEPEGQVTGTKGKARTKGGGDWAEVRKGNKALVVTEVRDRRSAISAIFHGVLGSQVLRSDSQATVTKQPFSVLPLEVHSPAVATVEDALAQLTLQTEVEARTSASGTAAARTNLLVESAPPVLILYLKRWVYESTGVARKVEKHVIFDPLLTLGTRVFPQGKPQERNYRLIGVIVHVGATSHSGHYVSYVPLYDHAREGTVPWLMLSDNRCTPVTQQEVQRQPAYLLLYMRNTTAALPRAPLPPAALLAAGSPPAPQPAPSSTKPTTHVADAQPSGPPLDAAQVARLAAKRLARLRPKLGVVVEDRAVEPSELGGRTRRIVVAAVKCETHLLQPGDVVVSMDGEAVGSQTAFHERANRLRPGDDLLLNVERAGSALCYHFRVGCQHSEEEVQFLQRVAKGDVEVGDGDRLQAMTTVDRHVLWGITAVEHTPAKTAPEPVPEAEADPPGGSAANATSAATQSRHRRRRKKTAPAP
eukprot:GGOE01036805.1.p1 GENE.GGOE01036805.1~~GGOE01036805.1.p1  ORF type:complete len:629 (-),score=151.69 GGOE01036805.1:125-1990(-)